MKIIIILYNIVFLYDVGSISIVIGWESADNVFPLTKQWKFFIVDVTVSTKSILAKSSLRFIIDFHTIFAGIIKNKGVNKHVNC